MSFSFLQSISRRNLAVGVVALGVALVLGVYLLFTAPAEHTLSTTNTNLKSEIAINAAAQSEYTATKSLGASAGALIYGEASALDTLLPQLCTTGYEKAGCFNAQSYPLINIPAIAGQTGMKVDTLSEGTADVFEGSTYYQYSISISGSYAGLVSFANKVTSSGPLATLASVQASATPTGISATILVDVWYTNDLTQPPSSVNPSAPATG
jgi:hypothetical protein